MELLLFYAFDPHKRILQFAVVLKSNPYPYITVQNTYPDIQHAPFEFTIPELVV
jgi:hypothetical protein